MSSASISFQGMCRKHCMQFIPTFRAECIL